MKFIQIYFISIFIAFSVDVYSSVDRSSIQLTDDTELSVKQSLQLAGEHLVGMLNPENYNLPYWEITIHPNYNAGMSEGWPAHNIGRWLDAMFRLEESIGFKIPRHLESAMFENLKRFYNNPDYICLNPEPDPFGGVEKRLVWDLHSLREGLLGLLAFAKYRNDPWAIEMGKKMIRSVNEKLLDDGTWDLEKFHAYQERGKGVIHNLSPSDTHGRMLEAIIWFYEATGSTEALQLAERIACWHLSNTTLPGGKINPAGKIDHTHSYLGTLRGLLLYGRLTKQHEYIERVADAYRANVPIIIKASGYTSHNMAVESFGETTSPGDAAQLALWLYEEGYTEFLDDVDRLVRSRILPSQIKSTPKLTPFEWAVGDKSFNLDKRVIGAYGGCHYHSPHGSKMPVTDVTSADIHTLIDVYTHIVSDDNKFTKVILHLSYEDDLVKVTSERSDVGKLRINLKKASRLAVRIPKWITESSLKIYSTNGNISYIINNGFAYLNHFPAKTAITLEYDLPETVTVEKDQGVEYKIYWKGDDIKGVSPNTDYYPLFKTITDTAGRGNNQLVLNDVAQVSRLTGKTLPGELIPNPNKTDEKYDVGGTDLGIMWDMGNGCIGMVFGDTYGSKFAPQPGGGPTGGPAGTPDDNKMVDNWRSNFVAFSTDYNLDNGLTIDQMTVDDNNRAKEIIPSAHDESGNGDFTTIPTAAIRVNNVDYIHYMSIRKWGTPKGWDTNFSSLYRSVDDGNTWERLSTVTFSHDSNFSQASYARKDGYIYMIGTQSGRSCEAYLARFPEEKIEVMEEYEYWNTEQGWVKNNERLATPVFGAPVGEISLMFHKKYKKWIAMYFDSEKYAIVYRTASDITGMWSDEEVLVSGHDYPQLYGTFMHPLWDTHDSIYFVMSLWRPYNVFLMKASVSMK